MKSSVLTHMRPISIITDFDRTLTFLYKDESLLRKLSKIIEALYRRYIGMDSIDSSLKQDGYLLWHKLHEATNLSLPESKAQEINRIAENKVTEFELDAFSKAGLFEGVPSAVKRIVESGIILGIVSSNSTQLLKRATKEYGIEKFFTYISGRPSNFNPEMLKPNPRSIGIAMEYLKLVPSECWYVGDDIVDMIAAKRAKAVAVGVTTGRYLKADLEMNGAEVVLDSFVEIPTYLKL